MATGSVRRRAQLAWLRPDLTFVELRGNMATRLEKARQEGAGVVAVAALERLGLAGRVAEILDTGTLLPQVAQGALAVECRADDEETRALLEAIDDRLAHRAVTAERAFLAELGGGCTLPVGALARPSGASVGWVWDAVGRTAGRLGGGAAGRWAGRSVVAGGGGRRRGAVPRGAPGQSGRTDPPAADGQWRATRSSSAGGWPAELLDHGGLSLDDWATRGIGRSGRVGDRLPGRGRPRGPGAAHPAGGRGPGPGRGGRPRPAGLPGLLDLAPAAALFDRRREEAGGASAARRRSTPSSSSTAAEQDAWSG